MPVRKMKNQNLQHEWSLLCSGVVVDGESNNLSMFNIIEQFRIPRKDLTEMPTLKGEKKPAIPVSFTFVTLWRKTQETKSVSAEVEVEFRDPKNVLLQKGGYVINLPSKVERMRSRMIWNGLRVNLSGLYTFKILLKEKGEREFIPVGEVCLKVEVLENRKNRKSK